MIHPAPRLFLPGTARQNSEARWRGISWDQPLPGRLGRHPGLESPPSVPDASRPPPPAEPSDPPACLLAFGGHSPPGSGASVVLRCRKSVNGSPTLEVSVQQDEGRLRGLPRLAATCVPAVRAADSSPLAGATLRTPTALGHRG